MYVSPDNLTIALTLLELIPDGPVEHSPWNGMYKLEFTPTGLTLMATDGITCIKCHLRVKDAPQQVSVNLDRKQFRSIKLLIPGASFEVSVDQREKMLILQKDHLQVKLPYNTSGIFPVKDMKRPYTWRYATAVLAKMLSFALHFIDAENSSKHKACATLYASGVLLTGTPNAVVHIKGPAPIGENVSAVDHISFTAARAKLAVGFLSHIGPSVLVSMGADESDPYEFRDPETGHTLILAATDAKFPLEDKERTWPEKMHIDRKWLLLRAKAFAAAAGPVGSQLMLTFKGSGHDASVTIATVPAIGSPECSEEGKAIRELSSGQAETPIRFKVTSKDLILAANTMEGKYLEFSPAGRLLRITSIADSNGTSSEPDPLKSVQYSITMAAEVVPIALADTAAGEVASFGPTVTRSGLGRKLLQPGEFHGSEDIPAPEPTEVVVDNE